MRNQRRKIDLLSVRGSIGKLIPFRSARWFVFGGSVFGVLGVHPCSVCSAFVRRSSNVSDVNRVGRSLNQAELDSYDVLPKYLARNVRVVSVPALPGGYDGMTLGYTILLAHDIDEQGNSPLLAHELVHVRQWAEQGRIRFSGRYLGSFTRGLRLHRNWKQAYLSVEAETEARRETSAWLRRRVEREIGHNPE